MKLNFSRLSALVFLFLGLPALAQLPMDKPVPVDPNVKMGKLDNGLTYYIRKNSTPENKVELRLAVNAGSVLEDQDQRGLAHFMEHMNFNGSKNFPKNELVNYLQSIGVEFGADLNAYTSFDETVYILPIPTDKKENVDKGFTVLEDWAFNNLLDKTEIDKERGVVLEESRLSKGAQQRMMKQYFPVLFNGSLYAERLPIGSDSVLQNFSYATLERFYRNWYRPNQMAVIVVGDIDPVEMENKIKAHFGPYKNPAKAPERPAIIPIKKRTEPQVMVITDEENPQTLLQVINYVEPSRKITTWAEYRRHVVEELVNSLLNNRLQELTRKEDPPFVFGYSGSQSFIRGYDAHASIALLGDNTAKEALEAIMAENIRARKYGFLEAELERAKANMMTGAEKRYTEREKSNSAQLVQGYLNHFLQGEPAVGAENYYTFIKQVLPTISLKEVNSYAEKIPSTDQAFAMLLAPAASKDKLPSPETLQKDMIAATKQDVKAYEEAAVASSLMEGIPAAGKIVSETKNEKLGTTNLKFANGVTVTLRPTTFKEDEIVMDAWRHGGWHRFPLADKDNAKNVTDVINEMGLKNMSPTDLEKYLSGKIVSVTPYVNEHEEGIQGQASVKDMETFLQLIHLYFTAPGKDEKLFKSMVNKNKGMLQFLKGSPQVFYQDTLSKIIYNNSEWVSVVPTEEEFNNLDLEKIMNIYDQIYGNANGMHFTFVGNIDEAKMKKLLSHYLGSLPSTNKVPTFKDNKIRPVRGVVNANIKKGKEEQSMITIKWMGPTEIKPTDNLHLRALLDVLNIKVIETLREEMGGIYGGGLNGGIVRRPYVHYNITASIPTGPDNVDKMTDALFEIIKSAQQGDISEGDLAKVKETLKKQYSTGIQTNDYWLDQLSNSFINGTNPEMMLEFEKRVDAITVKDLVAAANRFLDMKNYIRAVLYPENANVQGGVIKGF